MPRINQLSAVDKINLGDLFVIYATGNGDARKAAASVLLEFIKENLGSVDYVTQNVVATNDGFVIPITDNGSNVWTIISPISNYDSGAITLPHISNVVDGQEVLVFCTRQVNTFTVNGNGAVSVLGSPTALSAESSFNLRFNKESQSWYRVG